MKVKQPKVSNSLDTINKLNCLFLKANIRMVMDLSTQKKFNNDMIYIENLSMYLNNVN